MRFLALLFLLPALGIYSEEPLSTSTSTRETATYLQSAIGLTHVRQPWSWKLIEPSRGRYAWQMTDAAVEAAAARGMTILPFLIESPPWAAATAVKATDFSPPRDPADYARFAAAAVARYGEDGTFWRARPSLPYRPIRAWQIWNEPNLDAFWRPEPDAAAYVRLLRAAYAAIHAVDPGATVLMAGLPDSRVGIPLADFLPALYEAGARGAYDALAIHAYAPDVAGVLGVVLRARTIAARYGHAAPPLWVTEFGWASGGDDSFVTVDEATQAALASTAAYALRSGAAAWNLQGIFYFSWRDPSQRALTRDIWPYHTGLLRVDGSPKPAFAAYATAINLPLAATSSAPGTASPGRLRLRVRVLSVRRRALRVRLRCSRACSAGLVLTARVPRTGAAALQHVSGRWSRSLGAARGRTARLRIVPAQRRWLRSHRAASLRLLVTALTPAGAVAQAERRVRSR